MTEIGMVRHVGRTRVYGGHHDPRPNEWGRSYPQFLGPLLMPMWLDLDNRIWCDNTRGKVACFYGSPMHAPYVLMQRGSSVPDIFGTSYVRAHSMKNDNQILHGYQTGCEENFYRINHEC